MILLLWLSRPTLEYHRLFCYSTYRSRFYYSTISNGGLISRSNYRLFDDEAIEWLKGTIYFRQLGLSLADIRRYHDLCFREDSEALEERCQLLQSYCEKAEQELKEAKKRLDYLKHITEKDRLIAASLLPDDKNPYKKRKK